MRPFTVTAAFSLLVLGASGCATHPLGEDWATLDPAARDARVQRVLSDLIRGGVSGDGDTFEDREVISCDLERVVYRPSDGVGRVSSLRWIDIRSVTGQTQTTLPSRPETLFLYLIDDSPSTKSVRDLTQPVLSKVGLVSTYLLLRNRPRRSRAALIKCLDHLRKRQLKELVEAPSKPKPNKPTKPKPKPEPTKPKPKPGLEAVEAKLEKLKAWRDKGLINEEEYQAKKAELLKGL